MSDEEDYMSSSFLNVKEDIRPGLVPKSVKRKFEEEKKRTELAKQFRTKSRKELEEESRNTGLDSAISSDNKGFAMLQKMGYKPGTKLGRDHGCTSGGLVEPIKIQVKTGRGGLGREEAVRQRIEKLEERKKNIKVYREHETQLLTEDFRDRMRNQRISQKLARDLRKCQKICQQLDQDNGVEEPMRPWFWFTPEPTESEQEEEEEDEELEEEEEISPAEKLELICEYIRPKYFYCFWCCIRYDNEDDLNSNCPGPFKDDHDDVSS